MAASDPRRQWIERVLGITLPEDAAARPSRLERVYADLLGTVIPDLQRLAATDRPAAAAIAAIVRRAQADAQAGRFEPAVAALSEAADALAAAAGGARTAAAKQAIPEGTVARMRDLLAQSATRWDRARDAAQAGARSFQAELQARYPEEASGFQTILLSYWSDLSEAIAASGKGNAADAAAVVAVAQGLRSEMDADTLFTHLDRNGIAVRAAFIAALDDVETLLSA